MCRNRGPRCAVPLTVCLLLAGTTNARAAVEIVDPGQGLVEIATDGTGAGGLSGLAHAEGDRYYAVSDIRGRLFPLRIEVDPNTGFVTSARAEPPVRLPGGIDLEGIALLDPTTLLVCEEVGSVLRRHRLPDGAALGSLQPPAPFRSFRPNLGLESLARDGSFLWLANEEALRPDGATAGPDAGTRIRIQRLGTDGRPQGQWAYLTDPHPGVPLFGRAYSGVSELVALPGGHLLALERAFSSRGFRARLYQVDFRDATDTSDVAALDEPAVRPLEKLLLWEYADFTVNLEGAALGPRLAGGGTSLLLVSDDNGGGRSLLYPLILYTGPNPRRPAPRG